MPILHLQPDVTHVAAFVFIDDMLLIQRRSRDRRFLPDAWDVIGGAIEPGETLEQAAVREVLEEVGLRVTGLSTPLTTVTYLDGDRLCTEVGLEVSVATRAPRLEVGKASALALVTDIDAFVEDNRARGFGDHLARTAGAALLSRSALRAWPL